MSATPQCSQTRPAPSNRMMSMSCTSMRTPASGTPGGQVGGAEPGLGHANHRDAEPGARPGPGGVRMPDTAGAYDVLTLVAT